MKKIDIKNERELLGLPPVNRYRSPRLLKLLFAALIVFLAASGVGRLLGMRIQTQQQQNTISSFQSIGQNYDPAKILVVLKQLKVQAAGGNAEAKLLYSFACSYAAQFFPDYTAWLGEALLQINLALDKDFSQLEIRNAAILQQCGLFFELGDEEAAFESIKGLNKGKSREQLLNMNPEKAEGGSNYYNLYAYMLATAQDPALKDPEFALKLIKKIITLPAGRNAAYLDTLAEAYFAVDRRDDALRVQKFALAKSEYDSLWSLTEHYQHFTE